MDGGSLDHDAEGDGPEGQAEGAAPAGQGFYQWLGRVEVRLAQVAIVLMTLLVLTSAVARTAGRPVSWAVDLATFFFAWAVFLGADVALRRDRMVSIDLLVDKLSERARAWVQLFNAFLMVAFLIAMSVTGFWLSNTTQDRSFSGLSWLSYTWVTLAVPVGSLFMLYTMTHKVRAQIQGLRVMSR